MRDLHEHSHSAQHICATTACGSTCGSMLNRHMNRESACTIDFSTILKDRWSEQFQPSCNYCQNTMWFQGRRDLHKRSHSAQHTCDTVDSQPVQLNFTNTQPVRLNFTNTQQSITHRRMVWMHVSFSVGRFPTKNGSTINRQTGALRPYLSPQSHKTLRLQKLMGLKGSCFRVCFTPSQSSSFLSLLFSQISSDRGSYALLFVVALLLVRS
jgi:hypothetical protein